MHNMGVSKNRGTPKWMVKIMENPIKMDDLRGKPTIFGNIHIDYRESLPATLIFTDPIKPMGWRSNRAIFSLDGMRLAKKLEMIAGITYCILLHMQNFGWVSGQKNHLERWANSYFTNFRSNLSVTLGRSWVIRMRKANWIISPRLGVKLKKMKPPPNNIYSKNTSPTYIICTS